MEKVKRTKRKEKERRGLVSRKKKKTTVLMTRYMRKDRKGERNKKKNTIKSKITCV